MTLSSDAREKTDNERGKTKKGIERTLEVDGGLVLLDFGLSRFVGQEWDGRYSGTERYAAPEVPLWDRNHPKPQLAIPNFSAR